MSAKRVAIIAAQDGRPTMLVPRRSPSGRRKGESAQPLDFSRNTTIGRFELIRELARGGMGQVFLGRDPKLGRKVAIKFLLRDDEHFVQRFLVEARATAQCTHENIVTIHEVGEHDGLPYMVLEYLEGKTLGEVLDGKPSVRAFVELMVPVVRALERAHEHGIVHRDLKPSNVFVTDRGQVKVLDFGVARVIDRAEMAKEKLTEVSAPAEEFTSSSSMVGTLPYMSPEQWGADEVDELSDIWAIGIIFWRALVGVHPAGTNAPDKLQARLCDLNAPLPSIATRDQTLPKGLVTIIDKCLAKRKADRYRSASALLADLQAFLGPKTTLGEACPYRGLSAFSEDDAKYFFGRSAEIRTALAQLESWPLLAVIGPSGVGKSSFIHAGLVPAVRSAGGNWQVRVLRPGRVPLQRLATVLDETLETGEAVTDVMVRLLDEPGLFGAALRGAAWRRNQRVLVVVDQLEELFTLCDDEQVRSVFLAALLAAADDPTSPVRVVLSMRADFLDRLASHKHFLGELSRGLFFLTAPDRDNLREALVRPAELAGYSFEDPWIVDDMLHVATSRGALPLLSFAASRLWESRDREHRQLPLAAYKEMGGVGGAFARHADQVASAVPTQHQKLLRAIVTRLVTPEGTRAVVDRRELLTLATDQADVAHILDQLVRGRLIHVHTDPEQVASVELVHEMLITEWPTLRRWLEDSHAIRGFVQELRVAAKQWETRGKPSDLVWRGTTAQDALANAKRHVLDLAEIEKQFLVEVGRQSARMRRRKLFAITAIFTVLGLIIAGVSIAVVRITIAEGEAREQAETAEHQRAEAERARREEQVARKDLQGKLDIIAEKERAREAAERERLAEEEKRRQAEREVETAKGAEELSKEQLKDALRRLEKKVAEARAAETTANKAKLDAIEARTETLRLYAKEKAQREKLERELSLIDQRELK